MIVAYLLVKSLSLFGEEVRYIFNAAIFDLDGTIIDSMGMWKDISIDSMLSRNIFITDDIIKNLEIMTFTESAEYLVNLYNLNELPQALIKDWNDMAYKYYSNQFKLKSGVLEYLNYLKDNKIKLAIATSCMRNLCMAVLENNKVIHLFDEIVLSTEIGSNKSRPDIYLHTAKKLDVPPKKCMVYEDILIAIKSARQAGMTVTAVYDEYAAHEIVEIKKNAHFFINSFDELLFNTMQL